MKFVLQTNYAEHNIRKKRTHTLKHANESYERREIADAFWIPGTQNPADGLVMKGACLVQSALMKTNKIETNRSFWIERCKPAWSYRSRKTNSNFAL